MSERKSREMPLYKQWLQKIKDILWGERDSIPWQLFSSQCPFKNACDYYSPCFTCRNEYNSCGQYNDKIGGYR